ncbi:MAG: arylsulfatase [Sulfurovum sp.]|nr:MAG: arylsulfatase [Sulfurovum sp.]
MTLSKKILFTGMVAMTSLWLQAVDKPNILVIMADDIGINNVSAYGQGIVGYQTPNIDRIAKEGALMTDYYGQQSCTAGRSAFILGQVPFRTGLSKVGFPGAPQGIKKEDPTIAEMLKPLGYATGQFGKNHLGDRDDMLPTNHGFDEFYGNLYHLNSEEEPENEDYPTNPKFLKKYGPRGVISSTADGKIEDTGPLNKKRMETIDEEVLAKTKDFISRQKAAKKPWFVWFNPTRMHNFTHVKKENRNNPKGIYPVLGAYADGMMEHDALIGKLLDFLDDEKLTENTIVMYLSDNGPMVCLWPDAGSTPFRGEKNTNWEGGWRVPALVRWPNNIKPGTVINHVFAGEDWFPTLVGIAGNKNVKQELLKGHTYGNKTFKVHLDGYDQTGLLTGTGKEARKEFFYFSDDGDLLALRFGRTKIHFMVQNATGMDVWRTPFEKLRAPIFFDLKSDPSERGMEGMGYNDWWYRRAFIALPVQEMVGKFLATFKEFPPRQKPGSFTVGDAIQMISAHPTNN